MIEIEYLPPRKIIIHEILKDSLNNFLDTYAVPGNRIALRWIDGVLFHFEHTTKTPDVVSDGMRGIIHWEFLMFTKMEKFEPKLTNPKNKSVVEILDNTSNEHVKGAIEWLKKQPIWND